MLPPNRPRHSRDPWKVTLALAACMALQMTSLVMILPLFARRLGDFGAGVDALGLSALAFALAATVAAPFLGSLADRIGRRPLVLGSLAIYALAFTGFLLAGSAEVFVLVRGLAGGFTAGLIPAVMGTVADIAPADRRAQYVGVVNGGASLGWVIGPLIGGFLYDRWGYVVPFGMSVGIAALTLVLASLTVPETHSGAPPLGMGTRSVASGPRRSLSAYLRPYQGSGRLQALAVLLLIAFGVLFAWAFIEPQLMFYAYDDLAWTSSQLGLAMSVYGLAVALGEFALGRWSDRFGRKPILMLGLVLFTAQFAGLVLSRSFVWIAVGFVVAGLGNALFDPALSALFLDLAPEARRGEVMGMKSTAGSLGSTLGPGLVVLLTPQLLPPQVFLLALLMVLVLAAVAGVALRPRPASGRR
jgi:MFS family permease